MKLNKSIYTKQSHAASADHQKHYNKMSVSERTEAWWMLMRMAFGYVDKPWPKMDKNYFTKRKQVT